MIDFNEIKMSVTWPFQLVTLLPKRVYHPIGEKSMVPTGEQRVEYSYWDSQGFSKEEVACRVSVVSLSTIVDAIRRDSSTKRACDFLRAKGVPEDLQQHIKKVMLKRIYPAVFDLNETNNFKFTTDNVSTYPGVMIFDADNLTPHVLQMVITWVKNDPYTLVSFLSPRGNGYKWMVKVPQSPEHHKATYAALLTYYRTLFVDCVKLDASCININRTCFASHDPDVYVNDNAEVWSKRKQPTPQPDNSKPKREDWPDKPVSEMFKNVISRVEQGKRKDGLVDPIFFVGGSKHTFIIAVAAMCKGFGISHEDFKFHAKDYLINKAAVKDTDGIYNKK